MNIVCRVYNDWFWLETFFTLMNQILPSIPMLRRCVRTHTHSVHTHIDFQNGYCVYSVEVYQFFGLLGKVSIFACVYLAFIFPLKWVICSCVSELGLFFRRNFSHLSVTYEAVHMMVSCLRLLCGILLWNKNLILCLRDITQIAFTKEMGNFRVNSSLNDCNLPYQGACCCIVCKCPVVKILHIYISLGNTNFF